jgi:hypothetical protein
MPKNAGTLNNAEIADLLCLAPVAERRPAPKHTDRHCRSGLDQKATAAQIGRRRPDEVNSVLNILIEFSSLPASFRS